MCSSYHSMMSALFQQGIISPSGACQTGANRQLVTGHKVSPQNRIEAETSVLRALKVKNDPCAPLQFIKRAGTEAGNGWAHPTMARLWALQRVARCIPVPPLSWGWSESLNALLNQREALSLVVHLNIFNCTGDCKPARSGIGSGLADAFALRNSLFYWSFSQITI